MEVGVSLPNYQGQKSETWISEDGVVVREAGQIKNSWLQLHRRQLFVLFFPGRKFSQVLLTIVVVRNRADVQFLSPGEGE
jgi:hypothetical protein